MSHKEYSKCSKDLNTIFVYKMLINADVKVVPEVLYIAMIDSLRQQFLERDKQAEKEKSQTAIERDILFPCVRYTNVFNNDTTKQSFVFLSMTDHIPSLL